MDLDAEWLEADGAGGFASGTAGLVRTRRYHALLLASTSAGRFVLVNGMEVFAETASGRVALSSQGYQGGSVFPDGRWQIAAFTPAPWPSWTFPLPGGGTIRQDIVVCRATQEVVLRWSADRPVRLTARPLLSGRDYHALHHENPAFDFTTHQDGETLAWRPYPDIPATTARGDFTWQDGRDWYRRFSYAADLARGLDDGEDLACPGSFLWETTTQATLVLRAGAPGTTPIAALDAPERVRRARPPYDVAADAYLTADRSILAGFPWFTAWGRDTFIALRGLLLARGRLQEAAEILLAWCDHVSEGMLPNRFPDGAAPPEYNSADASLWFIVTVHELIEAGGASRAVTARLRAAATDILEGYTDGTRFGIKPDPADGLLRAGVPGVQVTWMDAKIGDHVVTPRIGKPVELQALWVNALAIGGRWPGGDHWVSAALRARDSVIALFPDRATGGLIDVLDADGIPGARDTKIRPNQVLAAGGLPIPVLTPRQITGVVALAERSLLTPLGLRTLAPDDPEYRPYFRGSPAERDTAYHQGTVWPWLMGPFVAAWLASRGNTAEARAEARARFLPPLQAHLHTAGLGHVSEVADGEAPHTPGGCPFQAWSLGELIRIEAMLGVSNGR
ncbi:amylo-alpha-1,6-glucosidase [Acidisphaera sp. L21]|uniref:amylo-alpha-1,6-glucosidase n=1 Tax=Acidisphaera sp. L21 TaxID=1641851 RepID=UPI00131AE0D7|nr:amylo-alpha-1,6-glucosidase [Acidisphaera sp. L21]